MRSMRSSKLSKLMPIASVLLHRVCATVCQLNSPSWHTLNPLFSLSFILMCATCATCATLFRLHIGVFYILMNYFFNLTYIKNRWHTWHTCGEIESKCIGINDLSVCQILRFTWHTAGTHGSEVAHTGTRWWRTSIYGGQRAVAPELSSMVEVFVCVNEGGDLGIGFDSID